MLEGWEMTKMQIEVRFDLLTRSKGYDGFWLGGRKNVCR